MEIVTMDLYTVEEMAHECEVDEHWLRRMAPRGYIPRYNFRGTWLFDDDAKPVITELAPQNRGIRSHLPEPQYTEVKQDRIGYSVTEYAELVGVTPSQVTKWARDGEIAVKDLGNKFLIYPQALDNVPKTRSPGRKRKEETNHRKPQYRTHAGKVLAVKPMTEKELEVIRLVDEEGKGFTEIGKLLGITKQGVSDKYRKAKYRQSLLSKKDNANE